MVLTANAVSLHYTFSATDEEKILPKWQNWSIYVWEAEKRSHFLRMLPLNVRWELLDLDMSKRQFPFYAYRCNHNIGTGPPQLRSAALLKSYWHFFITTVSMKLADDHKLWPHTLASPRVTCALPSLAELHVLLTLPLPTPLNPKRTVRLDRKPSKDAFDVPYFEPPCLEAVKCLNTNYSGQITWKGCCLYALLVSFPEDPADYNWKYESRPVVIHLGISICSWTTIPISPDHWPCWLVLMGTAGHENLESFRLVTT